MNIVFCTFCHDPAFWLQCNNYRLLFSLASAVSLWWGWHNFNLSPFTSIVFRPPLLDVYIHICQNLLVFLFPRSSSWAVSQDIFVAHISLSYSWHFFYRRLQYFLIGGLHPLIYASAQVSQVLREVYLCHSLGVVSSLQLTEFSEHC